MDTASPISFGELLTAFRKRHFRSQSALASAVGIHRNTISRWERGEFLPDTRGIVLELARHLRLDSQETRQLLEASLTALALHWSIPVLRNPFFSGRLEILQELHTLLSRRQSDLFLRFYALSGMGGVGKTQLAVEYAYQYALKYSAIFWIEAESVERVMGSFFQIAEQLKLFTSSEINPEQVMAAVQRWLSTHHHWLLIWDNLEAPDLLQRFLPTSGQGTILMTVRQQPPLPVEHVMKVPAMESSEGVELLLRRAMLSPEVLTLPAAVEIVTHLQGLPLALDQAGAYIEETGCGIEGYLARLKTRQSKLLERRGQLTFNHPDSVTTTFTLAFERLENNNHAAAEILRLCTFLYPDAIPEEIITEGANELGSTLGAVAADPLQLDAAIAALLRFSLMHRSAQTQTLSLHRLVQAVVRESMDSITTRCWIERTVCSVNAAFPLVEFSNWPKCERLIAHAYACYQLIVQNALLLPEAYQLSYKAGCYLFERGSYTEAEAFLRQALTISEQSLGAEHSEVATVLTRLGLLLIKQERTGEAELFCRRALAIREQQLGPEDLLTVESLLNLGEVYWEQAQYEQAEIMCQRALTIREQRLGPSHPDTLTCFNNLATLYWRRGKYKLGEAIAYRTLAIYEEYLGPEHPEAAYPLLTLALIYQEKGEYEQAEVVCLRALAIREQQLGPHHPATAIALGNLASVYRDQRNYPKAEALLLRALAIREQQIGPDSYILNSLAAIYRDQGKYEQAEPLYQQALLLDEQQAGPVQINTANTLKNLAFIFRQQGRHEQSERFYQRALTITEQLLGSTHLDTAKVLAGLAELYECQGKEQQAGCLLQRALMIYEEQLGEDHPETLKISEMVR
jgi:tetratricopeptide (TPR) repeat protein